MQLRLQTEHPGHTVVRSHLPQLQTLKTSLLKPLVKLLHGRLKLFVGHSVHTLLHSLLLLINLLFFLLASLGLLGLNFFWFHDVVNQFIKVLLVHLLVPLRRDNLLNLLAPLLGPGVFPIVTEDMVPCNTSAHAAALHSHFSVLLVLSAVVVVVTAYTVRLGFFKFPLFRCFDLLFCVQVQVNIKVGFALK